MPLTATISMHLVATLTNALDLSTAENKLNKRYSQEFANGAGANQANKLFQDQRTLTTGANEDIDVSGSLTDALGQSAVFTGIKALAIRASASNTTNLTVSRPASNGLPFFAAASDAVVLKPGGMLLLTDPSAAGIAVTAGTGDLVNIANAAGASAVYDIVIVGI